MTALAIWHKAKPGEGIRPSDIRITQFDAPDAAAATVIAENVFRERLIVVKEKRD